MRVARKAMVVLQLRMLQNVAIQSKVEDLFRGYLDDGNIHFNHVVFEFVRSTSRRVSSCFVLLETPLGTTEMMHSTGSVSCQNSADSV